MVPSLLFHNLYEMFESDWWKTVVCIVPTMFYTQSAKVDLDLEPHNPKSIGILFSSSTTYLWSLKWFGVNCIVSTRFYRQRAKVDLGPCDPKSIGFLISSWTTNMLSLKVIQANCSLYRAHKVNDNWQTHAPSQERPHYNTPSNAVARG